MVVGDMLCRTTRRLREMRKGFVLVRSIHRPSHAIPLWMITHKPCNDLNVCYDHDGISRPTENMEGWPDWIQVLTIKKRGVSPY